MISSQTVHDLLRDSLFRDNEPTENRVEVEATMKRFGFHPERLESHRTEVIEMLQQLDDAFMDDGGMGMSLMNMVADKEGNQWGEQMSADHLFALAKGLDLAEFTMPREMWKMLPGSMPYITIKRSKFK
jgi:hypothetical protein